MTREEKLYEALLLAQQALLSCHTEDNQWTSHQFFDEKKVESAISAARPLLPNIPRNPEPKDSPEVAPSYSEDPQVDEYIRALLKGVKKEWQSSWRKSLLELYSRPTARHPESPNP